ncbi:glycoside hydrolase family 108 protein [Caulobacter soli]|uniref:glycoside hydrolase family 108 protein n=1 Tax=Caulobacter soli TaxID=2708539 RepID=UPI0013EA6433|nr:glycosyl hydrolase 108 family protein [Caulobacter soli]
MTDDEILDRVLLYEGGYVNHANDKGGATNFGVTAATLGAWRNLGRKATSDEVRDMSRSEAIAIYKDRYITQPGFGVITDGNLKMIVIDCAVLYGPRRATIWLQTALGVSADGAIGNQTTTALAKADPKIVGRSILSQRVKRIHARVAEDPTQAVFLKGWLNRANDLLKYAA